MKFQNAFKHLARDVTLSPTQNQQIRYKLIDVMEDQIKLFELTNLFIKVFTWIILMHFISVAVIIGIGSIDFLIVSTNYFIVYIIYLYISFHRSYHLFESNTLNNEHNFTVFPKSFTGSWNGQNLICRLYNDCCHSIVRLCVQR